MEKEEYNKELWLEICKMLSEEHISKKDDDIVISQVLYDALMKSARAYLGWDKIIE